MSKQFRAVLIALALFMLGASSYAHTSYTGYSGAPGSKGFCASSCHGSAGGTIAISGFPSEYYPGQTYIIAISHNGGSAIKQFNGSCRIGDGSENAGTIASGTNTSSYSTTGESNGIHLSSSDLDNATFSWTAPPTGTGSVTLYIAGHQGSTSGPNTEMSFVSTEVITDVDDSRELGLPNGFKLSDNYPNPFNMSTTIEFYLPQRSRVAIDIFNVLGEKVVNLTNKEYAAGNHKITWNGLSSEGGITSTGIYFYRLQAGDFIETKKMVLLK